MTLLDIQYLKAFILSTLCPEACFETISVICSFYFGMYLDVKLLKPTPVNPKNKEKWQKAEYFVLIHIRTIVDRVRTTSDRTQLCSRSLACALCYCSATRTRARGSSTSDDTRFRGTLTIMLSFYIPFENALG